MRRADITIGSATEIAVGGDAASRAERDEILRLTGEVVVAWAEIDEILSHILGCLAECDESAALVIYHTPRNFGGRLEMIQNLAKQRMPKWADRETLMRALDKLDRLSKSRNSLIHSGLFSHADGTKTLPKYTHIRYN
jgi:hypothetical protein